jgi:hypothetical protein
MANFISAHVTVIWLALHVEFKFKFVNCVSKYVPSEICPWIELAGNIDLH